MKTSRAMVAESVCFYLPRQKQATELIRLADLVLIHSRNGDFQVAGQNKRSGSCRSLAPKALPHVSLGQRPREDNPPTFSAESAFQPFALQRQDAIRRAF